MGRPKKRMRTGDTTTDKPAEHAFAPSPSASAAGPTQHFEPTELDLRTVGTPHAQDWNLSPSLVVLTPPPSTNPAGAVARLLDHSGPIPTPPLNPVDSMSSCACLSTLYLTLYTLSSLPAVPPFPSSLVVLRGALKVAEEVLACRICPERFLSAVQNTQVVGTLIVSCAERFSRVLEGIEQAARRAGDGGPGTRVRVGGTGMGMGKEGGEGVEVLVSPEEWRTLAKRALRVEVLGTPALESGVDDLEISSKLSLIGVIEQMEKRQMGYIEGRTCISKDYPKGMGLPNRKKEDHICLKICEVARKMVEGMVWT